MIYLERPIFPGAWVRAYRPVYFTQGVGQMKSGANKVDAETKVVLHEWKDDIIKAVKETISEVVEYSEKNTDLKLAPIKETLNTHKDHHDFHYEANRKILAEMPKLKEEIKKELKDDEHFNKNHFVGKVGAVTGVVSLIITALAIFL